MATIDYKSTTSRLPTTPTISTLATMGKAGDYTDYIDFGDYGDYTPLLWSALVGVVVWSVVFGLF